MPPKKEEKPKTNYLPEIIIFLLVVYFLDLVYFRASYLLSYYGLSSPATYWAEFVFWFTNHFWPVIKIASVIVAALAAAGIAYSHMSFREIEAEEKKLFAPHRKAPEPGALPTAATPKNDRWERVVTHVNSSNQSDWRFAVLEADIMLDDLLTSKGYHGESIGEKLKSVDKSDFTTIDNAWAAHKIRNQIAHQGADYPLNEREAKQAVAMFESVFKEFKII